MKDDKKSLAILAVSFIIIVLTVVIITTPKTISAFSKEKDIFNGVEFMEADLNSYTVYGTHLNLDLNISNENDIDIEDIYSSKLVFRDSNKQDTEYDLLYEFSEENIDFFTSENINTGIDLDEMNEENYYVVLKVITKDLDGDGNELLMENYYKILNSTEYNNLEYYTVTKDNQNNKIDITFDNIPTKDITTLHVNVSNTNLPEDVYDVVIDAGHGGTDTGASANGYTESEVTLKYSLLLKEKLEKAGLKVKLTREDNNTRIDTYGVGGRYVIPNEVKSKLLLSIHLNSSEATTVRGLEIYSPNNSDLTLAKNIATSLVEEVGANYSSNRMAKEANGVYVRNFTDAEIQESKESAIENGFEPYNITKNTPYYGIIRETRRYSHFCICRWQK